MQVLDYKQLRGEITKFQENTQEIVIKLANSEADLGSRQNLANDDYAEILKLTNETDALARTIMDRLTELSGYEDEPGLTNKMATQMMGNVNDLTIEFKAIFELFQSLHKRVIDMQRVDIQSIRSSMVPSTAGGDDADAVRIISPGQHTIAYRTVSDYYAVDHIEENDDLDDSHGENAQLLGSCYTSQSQFMLDLMREKQRDLAKLESQASELYSIQVKLANFTKTAEENIDHIESNIHTVEIQTEKATEQLVEANVSKNKAVRKKCTCIAILILAAIVLLLILVIAIYYKFKEFLS